MTGARLALGCVVMLSGSRTAPAEPCAARAEIEGEPAAVAEVTTELSRLGVRAGKLDSGCPGIVAHVVRDASGGGLAVAIRDRARRSEGRVVSDASVAATWIDSWLRDDLDEVGLAAPVLASSPALPALQPPGLVPRRDVVPASRSRRGIFDRVSLAAGYEQAWSSGGAAIAGDVSDDRATGFTVAGCVKVGGACIGARGRHAREPERTLNLTGMARGETAVLATIATSIALGHMIITPELGLGFGRTTTRRLESCVVPNTPPADGMMPCDPTNPMDPGCLEPPPPTCTDPAGRAYVGDGLDVATFAPRVAAALRIRVPLFDHVWLDASAGITAAPGAHTGAFGPLANPTMLPDESIALPGEADRAFQLGIGLGVGAP